MGGDGAELHLTRLRVRIRGEVTNVIVDAP